MKQRSALALVGLVTCAVLSSDPARAGGPSAAPPGPIDKATCLNAVSKGQRLRDSHRLVEAREKFRTCARAECPAVLQTDCAGWLTDVERTLPTVVLSAKDGAGHDLVDVKVSVDGEPIAKTLDGQAVAIDPGLRRFLFENAEGKTAAAQLLVKEGEKAVNVSVVFGGGEVAPVPLAPLGAPAPLPQRPAPRPSGDESDVVTSVPLSSGSRSGSTVRLIGLLVGGAGIAAMGASAVIAVEAKSKDNTAANENPTARVADSQSAVNEGDVATVVFGVGAGLALAGIITFLAAPSGRTDTASRAVTQGRPSVAMGTDGRAVFLWGSF
jgi:hypothetical protein